MSLPFKATVQQPPGGETRRASHESPLPLRPEKLPEPGTKPAGRLSEPAPGPCCIPGPRWLLQPRPTRSSPVCLRPGNGPDPAPIGFSEYASICSVTCPRPKCPSPLTGGSAGRRLRPTRKSLRAPSTEQYWKLRWEMGGTGKEKLGGRRIFSLPSSHQG